MAKQRQQPARTTQEAFGQPRVVDLENLPAEQKLLREKDPAREIAGVPPGIGQDIVPPPFMVIGRSTTSAQTYRDHDEARRHSRANAAKMLNEPLIKECLDARRRSVAQLNWHLEPEDEADLKEKEIADGLTDILKLTPNFTEMRFNLMYAVWYGRTSVMNRYHWERIRRQGRERIVVKRWTPVNGDKLVFRWDDGTLKHWDEQVGIRVGGGFMAGWEKNWPFYEPQIQKIEPTDQSRAYFLDPYERKRLVIHKHEIEDGAFEDPLAAGSIHGVGVRSRIYWTWYQMMDAIGWLMEFLERSAFGIELWTFPQGNPEAEAAIRTAAEERIQSGNRTIVCVPIPSGEQAELFGMQRHDASMSGAETLRSVIADYFGHKIKRLILGQTLTTEAQSTGIGQGASPEHRETFQDIVRYDANKLGETLTSELVTPLREWNYPEAYDCRIRMVIDTEAAELDRKLTAWEAGWRMGLKIKTADLYGLLGASQPTEDDDVIQNPQFQQQGMGGMPGAPLGGWPELGGGGGGSDWVSAGMSRSGTPKETNPATGETRYVSSADGDRLQYKWVRDPGPRSQNRWTNTETGKHFYGDKPPGEATAASPETGDLTDYLAETFRVGQLAYQPEVLHEAYTKQLTAKTVQQLGPGQTGIMQVELREPPSDELKTALFSQLHGAIVEVDDRTWNVVSETNVAHEGTGRWVKSLADAGGYLEKQQQQKQPSPPPIQQNQKLQKGERVSFVYDVPGYPGDTLTATVESWETESGSRGAATYGRAYLKLDEPMPDGREHLIVTTDTKGIVQDDRFVPPGQQKHATPLQSAAAGDRLTSAADGRKYGDKPPGKGWQGPFKGQRGGTYWLPPKGKQPASKPSRKPKNPKAAKAIQSHKPSTREKQVFALQQEDIVAAGLGGTRLMDNEPMDVILERPPGTLHGFEIKTLTDNTNNKITMHPESRRRKEEWAKGGKRFIHTIVIDGRDEFGEGRNADQYSGHKVYYSTGVGAFRIKSMERAASFDELLERLAT